MKNITQSTEFWKKNHLEYTVPLTPRHYRYFIFHVSLSKTWHKTSLKQPGNSYPSTIVLAFSNGLGFISNLGYPRSSG